MYIFKDAKGQILYVGKANNIAQRVAAYFKPPVKLEPKTALLVSRSAAVDYVEVTSEIEALLLEARLIKKFQPPFNSVARDDKSPYYIHFSREVFPKPLINHQGQTALAGPFVSAAPPRRILRELRRVSPFCTAPHKKGRPCFYSHLGLCQPCPNDPATTAGDYRKNIRRLQRLLKGQFQPVLTQLKRQMVQASRRQDFEKASRSRDQIKHLEILLTSPIAPDEFLTNPNLVEDRRTSALEALRLAIGHWPLVRIEMYDVAHLAGTAATGAMTVATNGAIAPSHYRHFTIKTAATDDDVAMLAEVLKRRLRRSDWPSPDLIVLDGGAAQLASAQALTLPCPVIALAKKQEVIYTSAQPGQIQLAGDNPGLQLLQHLRDEAHRFARRLHHKHRSKSLKVRG